MPSPTGLDHPEKTRWWGAHDMSPNSGRRWRVGPLTVMVDRLETEWRVVTHRSGDPLDATIEMSQTEAGRSVPDGADVLRIAETQATTLTLRPMLADLDIVSRPRSPFVIPPGQKTTIFVGTPLWLQLLIDDRTVLDVPIAEPRRTWFGDHESGQLAYSSRTFAATAIDELVVRPHRARSAVTLQNNGVDNLSLKRLLIPTRRLSLSIGDDGSFWTEDLDLVRSSGLLAEMQLTPRRWKTSHADTLAVSAARVSESKNAFIRVFAPLRSP